MMNRLLSSASRFPALISGTKHPKALRAPWNALFLVISVACLVTSAAAQSVNAVEDITDVNGLGGGFQEVATGLTWLDYSNFFGKSFLEVQQSLVGTGFRLAKKSELDRLLNAVGQANDRFGVQIPFGGQSSSQKGFYDDSSTGSDPQLVGVGIVFSGPGAELPIIADDGTGADSAGTTGAWVVQQTAGSCDAGSGSLDFDCDGSDEKVVWRPSSGMWFVNLSASTDVIVQQWGLPGDTPIAGDYDGDGIPDLAVWRPSTGTWFIKTSMTQYSAVSAIALQFGLPGDKPLRVDYDGDGRLDVAVWRPSEGNHYYVRSTDAQIVVAQWGLLGDIPFTSVVDD